MKHKHLREHLQVLRSHPDTVNHVLYALQQNNRRVDWREGGHTAWLAKSDVLILRMLNSPEVFSSDYFSHREKVRMEAHGVKPRTVYMTGTNWFHDKINKRAALKQEIEAHAVNGMIGIVESGRDCDCVEYVHPCAPIPATVFAYTKAVVEKGESADGPFYLLICTPEEAEKTESESRDLVMEAYEDGHPHSVYSRFP